MDFSNLIEFVKDHRFSFISWATTGVVVAALLGSTVWWNSARLRIAGDTTTADRRAGPASVRGATQLDQ